MPISPDGTIMFKIAKSLRAPLTEKQKRAIADFLPSDKMPSVLTRATTRIVEVWRDEANEPYLYFDVLDRFIVGVDRKLLILGNDVIAQYAVDDFQEFAVNYDISRDRTAVCLNNRNQPSFLQIYLPDGDAKSLADLIIFGSFSRITELPRIECEDLYWETVRTIAGADSEIGNYLGSQITADLEKPKELGKHTMTRPEPWIFDTPT